MDTRTPAQRRRIMQSVGTKNTHPEIAVRKIVFAMGYRYRLHRADLPGRPDIVLPKYRTVMLVHGCFWHGHGCKYGKLPKSHVVYWKRKIKLNRLRDNRVKKQLRYLGWKVVEIWQCQTRDSELLKRVVRSYLQEV